MPTDITTLFPFAQKVTAQNGCEWFLLPAEKIREVLSQLKQKHGFANLNCLTGTDRGAHIEIVYHIFSYERRESLVLKVNVSREANISIPSAADLFSSADWMERETYDLIGTKFEGHPDLRRILLPEDWEGHPLRKDYKENAEYQGMTTARE